MSKIFPPGLMHVDHVTRRWIAPVASFPVVIHVKDMLILVGRFQQVQSILPVDRTIMADSTHKNKPTLYFHQFSPKSRRYRLNNCLLNSSKFYT